MSKPVDVIGSDKTELPFAPEAPNNGVVFPSLVNISHHKALIDAIQPQYCIIPHNIATENTVKTILSHMTYVKVIVWEHTEVNTHHRPILEFIKKNRSAHWLEAVIVDKELNQP